jgi:hypothetical protein
MNQMLGWLEDNIPCRFMALGPCDLGCSFVEAEFLRGVFLYSTGQTSDEIFGPRRKLYQVYDRNKMKGRISRDGVKGEKTQMQVRIYAATPA